MNEMDEEKGDGKSTKQVKKSVGERSVTMGGKPGEEVKKKLMERFTTGQKRGCRIKEQKGTVDVFRGWVSSRGKTVQSKEEIARTVKNTSVRGPHMAEPEAPAVVGDTGAR
uniref:phage tail tube protein n=1 Tax=Salmonella enterica TaxID=28901 RepID=UPI00398C35FB